MYRSQVQLLALLAPHESGDIAQSMFNQAQRMQAPDLHATFAGRERPVRWRELPDIAQRGLVSFAAVMRPRENVCALAETFVTSPKAQPLTPALRVLSPVELDVFQTAYNSGHLAVVLNKSPATDLETTQALLKLISAGYLKKA